jgi:hypothetical protein
MKKPASETRKITVNLPASLVDSLMEGSEASLTETLKEAITEYKQKRAWKEFLDSRGKFEFMLTAKELKELRD